MFSKQNGYCRICGSKMIWTAGIEIPYSDRGFCSRDCFKEWQWRETLSICGKEYYPDPSKGDTPRDS